MMVELLAPLAADAILVIGALSLLLVDLILPPGEKRILGYGTIGVLLAALVATFALDLSGEAVGGAYEGDALALFFKRGFYVSAILASLASLDYGAKFWPRRQGEYFQLLLYSVLGMSLLAGVRDLLLLAVAFELMGVPLYAMAAFSRKDKLAVEGGLKLYLTGAVSSAVTLYGMSLLFGASGSTSLAEIASAPSSPMLAMGVALTLAGMGFKLGVAPFHMWVPDTYRGSSPPFVVLIAVAPKIAGIAALTRLLLAADGGLLNSVSELLLLLVWFTVIVGNVMALPQDSVRRLLGFSGVGHMGLLLLGLTTGTLDGVAAMLFYVAGYIFTTAGALLVLSAVADDDGADGLARFAGLSRRSGFLAFAMLVFLLSLGGIPFVVGFWAKLYLYVAAWGAGFQLTVLFTALVGVIGLYYYLRVARAMYMTAPTEEGPVSVDRGTQLAIALCLVFVIGMGLVPQPFVAVAETAASVLR